MDVCLVEGAETMAKVDLPEGRKEGHVKDPSQYVINQMEALEAEQNHIDTRAGVVERNLRQLLETGSALTLLYLGGSSPVM